MDSSLELWLIEFKRKLDDFDARMDRRWAARQQGAAVEPRIGGLEQTGATLLVEADNWGGLFDEIPALDTASSDSSSFLLSEKEQHASDPHIVADNWGGEFDDLPDATTAGSAVFPVYAAATEHTTTTVPDDIELEEESLLEEFPLQIQKREEVEEADEKLLPSTGSEELKFVVPALVCDSLAPRARDFLVIDLPAPHPPRLHPQQRTPLRPPLLPCRLRRPWWAAPRLRPWLAAPRGTPRRRPRRVPPRAPQVRRPRRAPRCPSPLRRPRRAPPRPPWLRRPRSPWTRGPRRAPPWRRRPLRHLVWRPPWRLASFNRHPRQREHHVRRCTIRTEVSLTLVAAPRLSRPTRIFSSHEHALGAMADYMLLIALGALAEQATKEHSVLDDPATTARHHQATLLAVQHAVKIAVDSFKLAHCRVVLLFHSMFLHGGASSNIIPRSVSMEHAYPSARQVFEVLSLPTDMFCTISIDSELLSHTSLEVDHYVPWPPPDELRSMSCDARQYRLLPVKRVPSEYMICRSTSGWLDDIGAVLLSDSTQPQPLPWPFFSTYAASVQLNASVSMVLHGLAYFFCWPGRLQLTLCHLWLHLSWLSPVGACSLMVFWVQFCSINATMLLVQLELLTTWIARDDVHCLPYAQRIWLPPWYHCFLYRGSVVLPLPWPPDHSALSPNSKLLPAAVLAPWGLGCSMLQLACCEVSWELSCHFFVLLEEFWNSVWLVACTSQVLCNAANVQCHHLEVFCGFKRGLRPLSMEIKFPLQPCQYGSTVGALLEISRPIVFACSRRVFLVDDVHVLVAATFAATGATFWTFPGVIWLPIWLCSRLLWKPPWELPALVEIEDAGLDDVVDDAESTVPNAVAPFAPPWPSFNLSICCSMSWVINWKPPWPYQLYDTRDSSGNCNRQWQLIFMQLMIKHTNGYAAYVHLESSLSVIITLADSTQLCFGLCPPFYLGWFAVQNSGSMVQIVVFPILLHEISAANRGHFLVSVQNEGILLNLDAVFHKLISGLSVILNTSQLCDQVLPLSEHKDRLYEYLRSRMNTTVPNLTALVDDSVVYSRSKCKVSGMHAMPGQYLGSYARVLVTVLPVLSRGKGFKFRMLNEDESNVGVVLDAACWTWRAGHGFVIIILLYEHALADMASSLGSIAAVWTTRHTGDAALLQGYLNILMPISSLVASADTNIAHGFKMGAIILLSDGYHFQIHTFSFGSNHDSVVMYAISDFCSGIPPFIEVEGSVQDEFAPSIGDFLSAVVMEMPQAWTVMAGPPTGALRYAAQVRSSCNGCHVTHSRSSRRTEVLRQEQRPRGFTLPSDGRSTTRAMEDHRSGLRTSRILRREECQIPASVGLPLVWASAPVILQEGPAAPRPVATSSSGTNAATRGRMGEGIRHEPNYQNLSSYLY